MSGIGPDNYTAFAKECLALRGTAFLVALNNGKWAGADFHYTAKQWGAWLAFFERAKIPHAFMKQRADEQLFYQVPTEWPHEFTTDATVLGDHAAGAEFEQALLDRRAREKAEWARRAANVEQRAAQAISAKALMREWRPRTPTDHLRIPEASGIDKAALFESYDEWQRSQQR